ncbi:MAG: hypothetical protein ABIP89_20130 [Polyangiaceae bacterium]
MPATPVQTMHAVRDLRTDFMKRSLFIFLAVVGLVGGVLGVAAYWRAREIRLFRAAIATVDVKSCPRAVPLGETCGRCVAAYCCQEIDACYGVDDCIDLNDCTVNCGEEEAENEKLTKPECRSSCAKKHPASVSAFTKWDECSLSHCAGVCPRSEKD